MTMYVVTLTATYEVDVEIEAESSGEAGDLAVEEFDLEDHCDPYDCDVRVRRVEKIKQPKARKAA